MTYIPISIDVDKRRRISGIVFDPNEPSATSVNALVFSLFVTSNSRWITTRDTLLPTHRLDADNSIFNILIYIRKAPTTDIPLTNTDYFVGGWSYYNAPIQTVQTAVEVVPKTNIYNATTKQGVNGWKLAKVHYRSTEKSTTDLFEGIRPPLVTVDSTNPVYQIALCLDTADVIPRVTAHVQYDLIEV